MDDVLKERLKVMLSVPAGLTLIIIPYSLLIHWEITSLFIFWFIITPTVALYLPLKLTKMRSHLFESLAGMMIFYGIIVFMIFDLYKTDFFRFMALSCVTNLVSVSTMVYIRKYRNPS